MNWTATHEPARIHDVQNEAWSGGCTWGWWDGEPGPRVVGVGSTIGDTTVKSTNVGTPSDNEHGGGAALSALIAYTRSNDP